MQTYKLIILGHELSDKKKFCEIFTGKEITNDSFTTNYTFDGREYTLEITDTAGTEEFPAMRELYTKQAHGIIYMYSSINQTTFNSLQNYRQQVIAIKPEHMPNIVVANHCDLEDQRVVSTEQGERLASQFSGTFFNVSFRLKNNMNIAFNHLIQQMDNEYGNVKPQTTKKSTFSRLTNRLSRSFDKKKDKI